jgi:DNA invertase Pin-like site-specific DNA recombinase
MAIENKKQHICVLYERVSTTRQDLKNNPGKTIQELRDQDIKDQTAYWTSFHAKHPEFILAERDPIYADRRSGTSLNGRIEFRKMYHRLLQEDETPRIDTVVVVSIDRLGRNDIELPEIMLSFQHSHIHIVAIKDTDVVDEVTTFDREEDADFNEQIYFMKTSTAAYSSSFYSKNLSRSSLAAVKRKIDAGIYHFGGEALFGYKWVGQSTKYLEDPDYKKGIRNRYIVVEEEAAIVREIFDLYVHGGLGIYKIAQKLHEEGKTRRGKLISKQFVRDVLSTRSYCDGSTTIRKSASVAVRKGIKSQIFIEQGIEAKRKGLDPVEYRLPPERVKEIVDATLTKDSDLLQNQTITKYPDGSPIYPIIVHEPGIWEDVQLSRGKKSGKYKHGVSPDTGKKIRPGDAMLSGLLYCKCGQKMYSKGREFYMTKKGQKIPGGYYSPCREKQNGCTNSDFIGFEIDDLVWQCLCAHITQGDLLKKADTYWKKVKKGKRTLATEEAVEIYRKAMEEAENNWEASVYVYTKDPSPKHKEKRDESEKKYNEAKSDYQNLLTASEDDITKERLKLLSASKKLHIVGMGAVKYGPEKGQIWALGKKDKDFRRRMVLEFIEKVIYIHPAKARNIPKQAVIIYKVPDVQPRLTETRTIPPRIVHFKLAKRRILRGTELDGRA